MKFGNRFSNLLGIKCTKFYSDSFRFDISTVQCLKDYFFAGHKCILCHVLHSATTAASQKFFRIYLSPVKFCHRSNAPGDDRPHIRICEGRMFDRSWPVQTRSNSQTPVKQSVRFGKLYLEVTYRLGLQHMPPITMSVIFLVLHWNSTQSWPQIAPITGQTPAPRDRPAPWQQPLLERLRLMVMLVVCLELACSTMNTNTDRQPDKQLPAALACSTPNYQC